MSIIGWRYARRPFDTLARALSLDPVKQTSFNMLLSRLNYRRLLQGATAVVLAALQGLACAQSGSTPLIWEVRSPTNTVYLFGTIHVGARKMYPLSPAVEQAYAASHVLALEADPTDQAAALAARPALGVHAAGQSGQSHLARADGGREESRCRRSGFRSSTRARCGRICWR